MLLAAAVYISIAILPFGTHLSHLVYATFLPLLSGVIGSLVKGMTGFL
jgi:hypothetical protein